jgi:ABC-type antimicrobial peptide transport system permease subunit
VRAIDPDLPVTGIGTLNDEVAATAAQPRFRTVLFALFGLLALLLSVAGIFGVISYWVTSRTREIGIRIALGAKRSDVLRLILAQGMRLTLAGVLAGLAGVFVLTRYLTTLLYGVSAHDPLTLIGVALGMTIVSGVACWIPALRATRADPWKALKTE